MPSVGSIDPDGMKKVWTTKARSSTATSTATTTTMIPSRTNARTLALGFLGLVGRLSRRRVAPASGPPSVGSSTTSAGSWVRASPEAG